MDHIATVTGSRTDSALPFRSDLAGSCQPSERLVMPGVPKERGLSTRLWHALARIAWEGLPVRYLGTMRLFSGHRVYAGPQNDSVLLNLADDPLFHDRHGFPMPARIIDDLRRIEGKVEMDALFVAHEVPRGAVVEDRPIPMRALVPPTQAGATGLATGLGVAGQAAWIAAALPLVAASFLAPVGATVLAAGLALDPVLLGVMVAPGRDPEPGELGAWFCLAQWKYGED